MYLRLRTHFDRYTQMCPRCENKQPYNRRTRLCINMHNSAKLRCGKLGGKCGKAHGIVGETKFFTRYRLYMERQYTLRIHFYDMLRAGTLKSSVKWIGNVISTYTKKACVFRQNKSPETSRLNSDKVLFSFARGRERCDRNSHAVFLRPGVDFATTGSEITGISTSSTKLK